jgi:hypothetical protein
MVTFDYLIDIVKISTSGQVAIYNAATGDFVTSYSPDNVKITTQTTTDTVKVTFDNNDAVYFNIDLVDNTQVQPAAAVPFVGNVYDLAELLATDFFFEVGGGGGGDDLATVLIAGNTAGATDINLNNNDLLNVDKIDFNTATSDTAGVGQLSWNDTDGTLDLGLKGGNVTLQVGQEQVLRVVNKTVTNINLLEANYQAVRVTGSQGQRLKVDLALATTDVLSAETIGLVTETINNNQEGFITTSGLIRGINTTGSLQSETWADGDIVYLSPTTAGNLTNIKPVAPNHLIVMGYVVYAHAVNGTIFVKVDNGYELDELHNVAINGSLANNDALIYESSTQLWKNKTIGGWNYIVKSANQDVTNSATLVDDTELQFSVVAGGQYMLELDAVISANNTSADYQSAFNVSSGTMKGNGIYTATGLTGTATVTITSANAAASTTTVSTGPPSADLDSLLSIKIIFSFTASANATFKYKFAQNVAIAATTARTFKGSILKYKKIN